MIFVLIFCVVACSVCGRGVCASLSFIICSKSNVSIKCLVDAKHPGSGHQVCLPSGGHTRVISGMIIHSHTTYICSAQ